MTETTDIYKLLKPLGYTKDWNNQDIQKNTCISEWFLSNHQHIQITETSRLYKRLEPLGYTNNTVKSKKFSLNHQLTFGKSCNSILFYKFVKFGVNKRF